MSLYISKNDLTQQKYECLVNAANGIGPMGRGIAGALKRAAGEIIQSDAFAVCKRHSFIDKNNIEQYGYNSGQAYMISSGRLKDNGVKNIVCAVTMWRPNDPTTVEICEKALNSAMTIILENKFKSVGFPAFGTGVGQLDKNSVAKMMVENLNKYKNFTDIYINDINEDFIAMCVNHYKLLEGK